MCMFPVNQFKVMTALQEGELLSVPVDRLTRPLHRLFDLSASMFVFPAHVQLIHSSSAVQYTIYMDTRTSHQCLSTPVHEIYTTQTFVDSCMFADVEKSIHLANIEKICAFPKMVNSTFKKKSSPRIVC